MLKSIVGRSTLVTCAVAVIAVVVTALVGAPLAIQEANRAAKERLADEATLTAELLRPRFNTKQSEDEQVIVKRLRARGIEVYLIRAGQADREGLPDGVVKTIGAGRQVPVRRALVGKEVQLLVGRPVGNAGNGVVLTEEPPSGTLARLWGQLWIALLAGLAAGLLAGALLARRIARPIRTVAAAANRLSAGDRSVTLDPGGPTEVADLARAVNALTAALATSEGRERDFLLSVSHELRTPLTTIRGYAEALADGVVGPDGAQRAGQTVLGEAERLDRLIADLLVLARLEAADLPVEVVDVDLTQLVATTAEAWGGRLVAAGLVPRTELPPMPVPARTDPGRIRQIIDGLLENALRVVPAGAPVVLALVWQASAASIEIRDGGPGFTDDDLAVAFERGALSRRYQGARKVGSGLGLALAARLARRLGGSIEAGHAPEGGARFTVTIPL
ncbi:HAMP domain-containing histidine kinase [Dactylosporangium aurantiacum]|uniref:histidine kinase n=1 Tax=Dactylosporangium aurantiacum TaxID=35754 RepID=A0A9Q9MJM0_9ACTN|nr:HAMP domain-containing sensor histidine kinase [Dactylosporangium aurantiacum]MDG6101131.1 HAMP domain-containing sensor histidine kinase [Dactylosporangium aurantiacum]UWZ54836.1 HAMP domain-containing histidine kinase [Dactylosporangium aurantiacum]